MLVGGVADFRARRRNLPLLPYEDLEITPRLPPTALRRSVDQRLRYGFARDGFSLNSTPIEIDWLSPDRSFAQRLNSWYPTTDVLTCHSLFQDDRYLDAAYTVARLWIDQLQLPAFDVGPDPAKLDAAFGPSPWYDMAVGQRAYRLAYLLDAVARDPRYTDDDVHLLLRSLIFHLHLLAQPGFLRRQSNHGFYQAFGELAACRRFRDEPFFGDRETNAAEQVRDMIDRQFFPGGLHREHSSGYHYMVLATLIGARASGLVSSPEIQSRIAAAEEILTWLIQPDGSLLTFGDTDPRLLNQATVPLDRFANPRLRYHLSHGETGERPRAGVLALRDEGYVFARSDYPATPDDAWWYLAQIASFHSRVHKHADDLSFVWSDRGLPILIDPGRYAYTAKTPPDSALAKQGFWYADPKRIYVESTRAHNTVEIDGRSFNRRRTPTGSSLRSAGEQNGLIVTVCDFSPLDSVRFHRTLVLKPGHYLLLVDRLVDPTGAPHDYRQHVHVHPSWTVTPDAADSSALRLLAVHAPSGQRLAILPLLPDQGRFRIVRGQEEPELLGWYSDKANNLSPCTTIVSERLETDNALFATLFSFDTDVQAVPEWTEFDQCEHPSTSARDQIDSLGDWGNAPLSLGRERGRG